MGGKSNSTEPVQAPAAVPLVAKPPAAPPPPPVLTGPTYEEQVAKQEALTEQNRINTGLNARDKLYSTYLDASDSSIDFVNTSVDQERANAALTGVAYELSDKQKAERIDNHFATVFDAGSQTRLEALFADFGEPTGFEGFQVTRGVEPASTKAKSGTTTETTTRGRPSGTIIAEETLGNATLLGG